MLYKTPKTAFRLPALDFALPAGIELLLSISQSLELLSFLAVPLSRLGNNPDNLLDSHHHSHCSLMLINLMNLIRKFIISILDQVWGIR